MVNTVRSVDKFEVIANRFEVLNTLDVLYRFEVLNRFELLIMFELLSRFELFNILCILKTTMFELFARLTFELQTIFEVSKIFEDILDIFEV